MIDSYPEIENVTFLKGFEFDEASIWTIPDSEESKSKFKSIIDSNLIRQVFGITLRYEYKFVSTLYDVVG
jgi:hypothetical protein